MLKHKERIPTVPINLSEELVANPHMRAIRDQQKNLILFFLASQRENADISQMAVVQPAVAAAGVAGGSDETSAASSK